VCRVSLIGRTHDIGLTGTLPVLALTLPDFYLRAYLKAKMYAAKVCIVERLQERIFTACSEITPQTIYSVS
jgi:hypothetical protein